ncbi:MAG TPA: hypothetical protein VKX16_16315 [Chloroflexota bacterium]|nr:hypothetical protein [Chloroflexota bacterium]
MEIASGPPVQTRRRLRPAQRIVISVLAVPILGWTALWGSKHVGWWTPAGHDIARVVRGAASINEDLLTPPQAYRNVPITAAQMSALSRVAQRKLADYYTGPSLSGRRDVAARTLNPRLLHGGNTSDWMTHWRVDWVHLGELTLLPGSSTATATGSAEYWSNGGVLNRLDYTWHLLHTTAGWRVSREESEFQLGYGP